MRLALIASEGFESRDQRNNSSSLEESLLNEAWEKSCLEQALALAKFIRDDSHFELCLFCREGSFLAREAERLSLPYLCLRSGRTLADRFKLWYLSTRSI